MCTSKSQKWGWIVPSLAVLYGLCSPGQVIVYRQRWKRAWKLHKLSGQKEKGMEVFLFTCRNVPIPAGKHPGQCLDKTKQWMWVRKPLAVLIHPGRHPGMWKPQSIEVELLSKFFQKIPQRIVCIICLLCISQSRYFTFYFWLFWGLNSSDFQSELNL